MADIIKFHVKPTEPEITVAEYLRALAQAIEIGDEKPAHKVVVVLMEERGDQFAVRLRTSRLTCIERTGLLHIALHDSAEP